MKIRMSIPAVRMAISAVLAAVVVPGLVWAGTARDDNPVESVATSGELVAATTVVTHEGVESTRHVTLMSPIKLDTRVERGIGNPVPASSWPRTWVFAEYGEFDTSLVAVDVRVTTDKRQSTASPGHVRVGPTFPSLALADGLANYAPPAVSVASSNMTVPVSWFEWVDGRPQPSIAIGVYDANPSSSVHYIVSIYGLWYP